MLRNLMDGESKSTVLTTNLRSKINGTHLITKYRFYVVSESSHFKTTLVLKIE